MRESTIRAVQDPHDPRPDRDPSEPVDNPAIEEPVNEPESPLEQPPVDDPGDAPEDEPARHDPDPEAPPMQV